MLERKNFSNLALLQVFGLTRKVAHRPLVVAVFHQWSAGVDWEEGKGRCDTIIPKLQAFLVVTHL
jgi:hypothetical protein